MAALGALFESVLALLAVSPPQMVVADCFLLLWLLLISTFEKKIKYCSRNWMHVLHSFQAICQL